MKRKIVIAILAIALLSVGAFIGSLTLSKASAQTSTPTTEATPVPVVTITPIEDDEETTPPFGRGGEFGFGGDDTAVAEKLGKTAEEMTAARTAALEKAVADAVSAGVITQAQADGITADGLFGWGQLARLAGADYISTLDQEKYFAEALGVTVEELEAARAEVRADQLAAAVEAGTITQAQADLIAGQQALANSESFQASVKTSLEAAINQAVTDGTITQAQADALISKLANQDFGRGLFGGGMFGGRGGMFGGREDGRHGGMMGGMMGGFQEGNRNGMLGELAEGLQNGLGKMFGGNQNGTPGGMMGGRQGGMFGGNGNGQGIGQGTGQGTCDGTCTQTNP